MGKFFALVCYCAARAPYLLAAPSAAEPHTFCDLGDGGAFALERHTGDPARGDICVDATTNTTENGGRFAHCPLHCRPPAISEPAATVAGVDNDAMDSATAEPSSPPRPPPTTTTPLLCEIEAPSGWVSVPPCRVPEAGKPAWIMPWTLTWHQQQGRQGRSAVTAPVELFDSDLPGPRPSVLHIAATSTANSNLFFNCWLRWITEMISADREGKYRLHLSGGAYGRDVAGGYYSSHWIYAVYEKVKFVRQILHLRDEAGFVVGPTDSLLFTDLDILPTGFYSRLRQTRDIMVMFTSPVANTGFYMVRNNNFTRAFVVDWARRAVGAKITDLTQNDQVIFNAMLKEPQWFDADIGAWDSLGDGQFLGSGPRCAALFDVKRKDLGTYVGPLSQGPNRTLTRCAAMHAHGFRVKGGQNGHEKLAFLKDVYGKWYRSASSGLPQKGAVRDPITVDTHGCVDVTYGPVHNN